MSAATVGFDGSGLDGAFAWWEPGQMRVSALRDALDKASLSNLLPRASTVPSALKETLSGFVTAANLKVRGLPIVINPLANEVKGCEAVQRKPGQQVNEFAHIMSIVLDETTDKVHIASHNPTFFSMPNQRAVEDKMTDVYRNQLDWYPTPMVSSCLARAIEHLGGLLCRKTGGVYYIPETSIDRFETLADYMDASEGDMSITITKFPLIPGERSYRLVAQSLEREVNEAVAAVEEALRSIGKQRANGKVSRTEMLAGLLAKVQTYENILGMPMIHVLEAIAKCQEAVDAHAAIEDLTL